MLLKVVFLGTGSAVPTKDRGLTSIAIKRGGEYILVDCGDGTQRQIIKSKLGISRLKRIFITHLHGDHFLGLPALLQTMSILRRTSPLEIYGPTGIKEYIETACRVARFKEAFPIKIEEFDKPTTYTYQDYRIKLFKVEHGDIPTYGIALEEKPLPGKYDVKKSDELGVPRMLRGLLQKGIPVELPDGRIVQPKDVLGPPRPGRKIVYSSDTRPTPETVKAAWKADLLIHDATFRSDMKERAIETWHSTVEEACQIARQAQVKTLALTHFSARYDTQDLEEIMKEAKQYFNKVIVAKDLQEIQIPL